MISPPSTTPSGWIPICKALVRELPKDRPFTRLEAMFSLTLDYDQGNPATLRGYAALWQWSTGKVERFLSEIGVRLEYPETTDRRTNQRGTITGQRQNNNGTINFIDSKWLSSMSEQRRDKDGTKTRRTKEPNPNPIKPLSEFFEKLWKAYPKKDGRKAAERHYYATVKDSGDMERINHALGNYLHYIDSNDIDPRFIKNGSTWFNGWTDWEITNG